MSEFIDRVSSTLNHKILDVKALKEMSREKLFQWK